MNKKTLAAAAAVLLAATFHASAEEGGGEGKDGRFHRRAGAAMIERMDRDGDGIVSAAEFMGLADSRSQEAFARMDTDGDGAISADEFREAATARAAEAFSRMDRNSDGRITRADFLRMKARRAWKKESAEEMTHERRHDRHAHRTRGDAHPAPSSGEDR